MMELGNSMFRLDSSPIAPMVPPETRAEQVLAQTLATGCVEAGECAELVDFGEVAESRQYQRLATVVEAQIKRLCSTGVLRRSSEDESEYDLTDEFIDDSRSTYSWVVGAPFLVLGLDHDAAQPPSPGASDTNLLLSSGASGSTADTHGGKLAAYLGVDDEGLRRLWPFFDTEAFSVHESRLLPVPTRPVQQGDWVFAVHVLEKHRYLVGRRGMCGAGAKFTAEEAARAGYGREACDAFWVNFEPPRPNWAGDVVCLPVAYLAAFAACPGETTAWEMKGGASGRRVRGGPFVRQVSSV
jgi:hypothetical protein